MENHFEELSTVGIHLHEMRFELIFSKDEAPWEGIVREVRK